MRKWAWEGQEGAQVDLRGSKTVLAGDLEGGEVREKESRNVVMGGIWG